MPTVGNKQKKRKIDFLGFLKVSEENIRSGSRSVSEIQWYGSADLYPHSTTLDPDQKWIVFWMHITARKTMWSNEMGIVIAFFTEHKCWRATHSPPVELLIEDCISLLRSLHVLVNWNYSSNFFSIMIVRISRNSLANPDSLNPGLDFKLIRIRISFCLSMPPWRTACLPEKPQTSVQWEDLVLGAFLFWVQLWKQCVFNPAPNQ